MATIHTIPTEILDKIFLWTCIWRHNSITSTHKDIDSLIRVCKTWRQVAITTPELWSMVDVCLDRPYSANDVSQLETWISRSGVLPLDLRLRCLNKNDPANASVLIHEFVRMVIGVLAVHVPRCRRLVAFLPAVIWNWLFTSPGAERGGTKLARLTELSLIVLALRPDPNHPYLEASAAAVDFSSCPQLAELRFTSMGARTSFCGIGTALTSMLVRGLG